MVTESPALSHLDNASLDVVIVGGGPAGLMAAEVLSRAGRSVHVFDAMPSVGRKFLLAGKGGLNLTHAEPLPAFIGRYGQRASAVQPWIDAFGPDALRSWAAGLGVETFVGTSQRVFPAEMKAAPLLRAWLHRLRHPAPPGVPVRFHMRHRWVGWDDDGALRFSGPAGMLKVRSNATVLALGGASWPRLGSDGAWQRTLADAGVEVAPLVPANCGFDVAGSKVHNVGEGWSPVFTQRWAGQPFKSVAISMTDSTGQHFERKGEFVATDTGVEGSLIYAVSAMLRDEIARSGRATFQLNLLPDRTPQQVLAHVAHPRGSRSLSSHLKSRLGFDGIKLAILFECLDKAALEDPVQLAKMIQALPITVVRPRPVQEAISSAGGVRLEALDDGLMVHHHPGLFLAGEMLDWEAPTGGYLLTATLASGWVAGHGVLRWLG